MAKNHRLWIALLCIAILALLPAACGGSNNQETAAELAAVALDEAPPTDEHASAVHDPAHTDHETNADDVTSSTAAAQHDAHSEGEAMADEHATTEEQAGPAVDEAGHHASDDPLEAAAAHGIPAEAAAVPNPVAFSADSAEEGALLFVQTCAVCHGPEGAGDGPGAAGLDPKPADLRADHVQANSDGALFYTISEGRPGTAMVGWEESFSETQRWHLVNFVRSLIQE